MWYIKFVIVFFGIFFILTPLYSQEKDVEELKNSLINSCDIGEINDAALALGRIGTPEVVQILIDVFKAKTKDYIDPLYDTRASRAEKALIIIGQPSVDILLSEMRKNKKIRENAANVLGEIKDPRAVEPLIKILQNDKDSRTRVATALGKLKDPRAVEPLIEILQNDKESQASVATALGELKDTRAVEPMIKLLYKSENSNCRLSISKALGLIPDPRNIQPLIFALGDQDNIVRQTAAYSLMYNADHLNLSTLESLFDIIRANKDLRFILSPTNPNIKRISREEFVPFLKTQLETEKDAQIREDIVTILWKIGTAECVDPLISAMNDENANVQSYSMYSLRELCESNVDDVLTALKDGDIVLHLLPFLKSQSEHLSKNAFEGLLCVGYLDINSLIAALNDENAAAGLQITKVLDSLKWVPENPDQKFAYLIAAQKWDKLKELDMSAVDPLISALKHEDAVIRQGSARTLGEINDPKALENLISTMNEDLDSNVKKAARVALLDMNNPRCIDIYISTLDSDDAEMRIKAARILADSKTQVAANVIPKIKRIIEEDSYVTEVLQYDSYGRASYAVLLNVYGIEILKKEFYSNPYNPSLIDWVGIKDLVSGNSIQTILYEFGKPKNQKFLCLDENGNIIRKSGEVILKPEFQALQKSSSTVIYNSRGFLDKKITKIYGCKNCVSITGLSNCRFVW
ncbi:MAG: HEAT repeat domain-containing protein [Bacteroidales bacterium]|nr:HEAT repeat domain-containing protein [Bacteroidales bacterium]